MWMIRTLLLPDLSVAAECEIVQELREPNIVVQHLFPQPIEGCFSKANEGVDGQ